MGIRDFLKPRQNNFVKLLLDQASLTLKGMELLKTYMDEQSPSVAQEIMMTEKEADEVRRILIDELLDGNSECGAHPLYATYRLAAARCCL